MRCAWRAEVSERLAAERFVFVDEMGSNTSLSPLYGWSRVGERLRVKAPKTWGKNVTLLSSMSMEGMGPSVAVAGATTRAVFEARGCELVYLPPYSPDMNPIEEAFAKVKGLMRRAEARTHEALVETMGKALGAVSARDARGFFEHGGYRAMGQPF